MGRSDLASKLTGALAKGVDALLHDPGARSPRLKTGTVVLSPLGEYLVAIERIRAAEATLAAPRYVDYGVEEAPADRVRRLGPFVEERWEAVQAPLSGSLAEVAIQAANGGMKIAGWKVTQHVRHLPRSMAHMTSEQVIEHVLSLQQAPFDDETYNGFYPTIPGNDVVHYNEAGRGDGMAEHRGGSAFRLPNPPRYPNGKPVYTHLRGGTEIRGGRAQLMRIVKERGMIEVGPGYMRDVEKIQARKKAALREKGRLAIERVIAQAPPRNPFNV